MCSFQSRTKDGELRCKMYEKIVTRITCAACEFGPGTRKHVREHPRARHTPQPLKLGEASWLRSLGIPAPKRPNG